MLEVIPQAFLEHLKMRDDLKMTTPPENVEDLSKAREFYRGLLNSSPNDPNALHSLGKVELRLGNFDTGLMLLKRALKFGSQNAALHRDLALVYGMAGQHDEAASYSRIAVQISPEFSAAWQVLGVALGFLGRHSEAVAAFDAAIAADPANPVFHTNRGNSLWKSGNATEAILAHQQAITLQPNSFLAYQNLGALFADRGDVINAIKYYRLALQASPESASLGSDWLYSACFAPEITASKMGWLATGWAVRYFSSAISPAKSKNFSAERRLRIGYVSPDFRNHTIRHLIEPILIAHDRTQFAVYCYSAVTYPDEATGRLKKMADVWRDIASLSDEAATELIQRDEIDILVDLTGHMAGNRLSIFARKPAGVQVQLGYASTTGLAAIDFRITDPLCDPPGGDERGYSEKLFRLPQCAWCYLPDQNAPSIVSPPVTRNGFITFCSLNRPLKLTDRMLAVWAKILHGVPRSQMIFLAGIEGSKNQWLRDRLMHHGVAADRVELVGPRPRQSYLELFNRIDIALDTFPYNGDTTTCDALWMGVPVITLTGHEFKSRRGLSHLHQLGLGEFSCVTAEHYVTSALGLAADVQRLSQLRQTLRSSLERSPLADGKAYTQHLENAYRHFLTIAPNQTGG